MAAGGSALRLGRCAQVQGLEAHLDTRRLQRLGKGRPHGLLAVLLLEVVPVGARIARLELRDDYMATDSVRSSRGALQPGVRQGGLPAREVVIVVGSNDDLQ